jgi:hypothetical protein
MNVQPKPSRPDDCTMPADARLLAQDEQEHRVPTGPRAFVTWPVEFEVEPWRP